MTTGGVAEIYDPAALFNRSISKSCSIVSPRALFSLTEILYGTEPIKALRLY